MKKQKAFTLVELIIVIAIIAILAVTAFLLLTKWIGKSRNSRRLSDIGTLTNALQIYYTSNNNYPMPSSGVKIEDIDGNLGLGTGVVIAIQGIFDDSVKSSVNNLTSLPKDPLDTNEYYTYTRLELGKKGFEIGGLLEADGGISYVNSAYANYSNISKRTPNMSNIYNDTDIKYMDLPYISLYSKDIGYLNQATLGSNGEISINPLTKAILNITGSYTNSGNVFTMDSVIPTSKSVFIRHALSSGGGFVCGLNSAGTVYCWGENSRGQLGDNTIANNSNVKTITSNLSFKQLSVSVRGTCGLSTSGSAYCRGYGFSGNLGNGTNTNKSLPIAVTGGLIFSSLGNSMFAHNCAITINNDAYCWGYNNAGQLGNNTLLDSNVPVLVNGGLKFSSISQGSAHTCGLTTSGALYCWGDNTYGQLGNASTIASKLPVLVTGGYIFKSVSVGRVHTCGLTTTGALYCWGINNNGQLGVSTNFGLANANSTPLLITGYSFRLISLSSNTSCGISTTGQALCWGYNSSGMLGDGTTTNRAVPTLVLGNYIFESISAGMRQTCGLTAAGKAYCWGGNSRGQLGDGTTTTKLSPISVNGVNF